jgi:hypothetical protein
MLLSTKERLLLLRFLPDTGDLAALRTVRGLQELLGFSPEELMQKNIVNNNGTYTWDPDKDVPAEIPIGEQAAVFIAERLQELAAQAALPLGLLRVYECLVPEEE